MLDPSSAFSHRRDMDGDGNSNLLDERLSLAARKVESFLDGHLTAEPTQGEPARPQRLIAAMRHGALNGGKRFRPFLVFETTRLFNEQANENAVLGVAAAIECVHCYSLIHDDLPAMDDDDLRRGLPTVHRAFDEASAILAGDALLTEAFALLAGIDQIEPETIRKIGGLLARSAGVGGMVGGQSFDLENEQADIDEPMILTTQAMKTGALIGFCCEAGALLGGTSDEEREKMIRYGRIIGLAFQMSDDLLDVTSDAATLGKQAGKDAAAGKKTLVGLHGIDEVRRRLDGLVAEAETLLAPFGDRGAVLRDAAAFVAHRKS